MINDIEVKITNVFFDQIEQGKRYLRFVVELITGSHHSFIAYYYPDKNSSTRIPLKFSIGTKPQTPISIPTSNKPFFI